MESKWTLDTPDGYRIYGVLNQAGAARARSAIFIVHGLAGHMNEYAFKCAADYFSGDYDVYRFNLYDGADKGRALMDCTLRTHADDLNHVLGIYTEKYDKTYLIGHSYGGPTIMLANPPGLTAVSLWDPSFDLHRIQTEFRDNFLPNGDFYIVNWGTSYLIGKDMHHEAGSLDTAACIELSKNFKSPVQVIHAGDGFYVNDPLSYHSFGHPKISAKSSKTLCTAFSKATVVTGC